MNLEQLNAQSLLGQADQLFNSDKLDQACHLYAQVCQLDSQHLQAWLQLAKTQYQLEHYIPCLESVERALGLDPSNLTALLIASAVLLELGQFDQTVYLSDQVLAFDAANLAALLNKSTALVRLSRFEEALAMAERALGIDSRQVTAHLNRGLALYSLGHHQAALMAFDRALELRPGYANALINRSSVFHSLERHAEALQSADEALIAQPNASGALLNRAAALLGLQRPGDALETLDRILIPHPKHFKALLNKSKALQELKRLEEALQVAETALTVNPVDFLGLQNKIQILLGMERYGDALAVIERIPPAGRHEQVIKLAEARALRGIGHYEQALGRVEEVLKESPSKIDAILVKTEILLGLQQNEVALGWVEQGLAFYVDNSELLLNKSLILILLQRYSQALAVIEKVLASDMQHTKALLAKAATLIALGRFQQALEISQGLLSRQVYEWQAYSNLGGALAGLKRFDEARDALITAERLNARALKSFYAYDGPFHSRPADAVEADVDPRTLYILFDIERLARFEWTDYQARIDTIRELTQSVLSEGRHTPLSPFHSLSLPLSASLQLTIARSEAEHMKVGVAEIKRSQSLVHYSGRVERIKVGYVSADFRNHPTAHLMRSLFRLHDRRQFEIYGYALRKDDGSPYYRQIKANCDYFVDLTELSNAQAARRIHKDGIHILVDLMAYTQYARSEIFALQPAPIQVNYLGFPGTMGADFIDYIVVDRIVLPPEQAGLFAEQPVYLPGSYQVNDRWQPIAETGLSRADQGLPEQGFVFCCFNQAYKFDPVMFAVWMGVLRQVPDSVLWLYSNNDELKDSLRREAQTAGVAGERLIFADHLPKERHLERCRLADLFLDTRIYNAHTTASDALWAGLPVLTCRGQTFAGRVGASLLQAVNLPELITEDLAEYEHRAIHLATHPEELTGLRQKLWNHRLTTPLFDTERFARNLEHAYGTMWARAQRGEKPVPIWVPETTESAPAKQSKSVSRRFWNWGWLSGPK